MKYKAAIFDMDGTILNTIEDLADSMNHSLEVCGHKGDFSFDETKRFFGSGILNAIRRAIAFERGATLDEIMFIGTDRENELATEFIADEEEILRIDKFFYEYYPQHCNIKTGPFPGIHELLDDLLEAGVKTAVVSNKIDPAVQELAKLHFDGKFSAVLGVAESLRIKPYPDMVNAVLAELGVDASDAVYIGDSEIDVRTAANSSLDCIGVDWGFRSRECIESAGPVTMVSKASEIRDIILG
ncbi:MAG: HAD family hydrolase [Firmicutes bacterium]|nr:HAD family hydrolase [Bacillota bacterium]